MSHFIPEPSNYAEITRLPADVKKDWLKKTLRYPKFNQQLELWSGWFREGGSSATTNGYIQRKNPFWWKSWQVKVENCS